MEKNLFKDIFGFTDNEVKKMMDNAHEWVEDIVNEVMKNEKTNTYFNTKSCLFNDGKLTEKYEKEYVNGECTKDEHYEAPKTIEDNTNGECENSECCNSLKKVNRNAMLVKKTKSQSARISELVEQNKTLQNQINEMATYIDSLNDKIKKSELENAELKVKLDKVKSCL